MNADVIGFEEIMLEVAKERGILEKYAKAQAVKDSEQHIEQRMIDIAKKMLNINEPLEKIALLTDLPMETIRQL